MEQVAEQCADAALAKTNVAERQRQQSAAAVTSQPSADDDQPKDSGSAEEATEQESAADDKPKESGNAKQDSPAAAEPEAAGPASSNEMQLELYRKPRAMIAGIWVAFFQRVPSNDRANRRAAFVLAAHARRAPQVQTTPR